MPAGQLNRRFTAAFEWDIGKFAARGFADDADQRLVGILGLRTAHAQSVALFCRVDEALGVLDR